MNPPFMLQPVHISNGDIQGGAARAAYRIHRCLTEAGSNSQMLVRNKASDDWRVKTPAGKLSKQFGRLRSPAGKAVSALQRRSGPGGPRNSAWLRTRLSEQIHASEADVINLHWIAAETLSVGDIMRMKRPVIWTMHDMWPLCGLEHYAPENADARWRQGYKFSNRPNCVQGFDMDRHMWRAKSRLQTRQLTLVSPSRWLADCARASAQFSKTPIEVVGHPLDLSVFRPLERAFCRNALQIPQEEKIILFGAIGGGTDPRKGFDLLQDALRLAYPGSVENTTCAVFGQCAPKTLPDLPIPVRWLGRFSDDLTLAMAYSAADVMVVPSRQEAFGLTAAEAAACGCPVVAFDGTGVADIVSHRKTGFLARPFDAGDLAAGLSWVLEDDNRRNNLAAASRLRSKSLWSYGSIASRYQDIYASAADTFKSTHDDA